MSVSSIGVVAITPTTAVSRPTTERVAEQTAPVFQATERPDRINTANQNDGQSKTAERVLAPSTQTAAQIRGTGLLVDKLA